MPRYGILVHGGAGDGRPDDAASGVLRDAVRRSHSALDRGAGAVGVARACIVMMEDSGAFNAGLGSCLTRDGTVEMDAGMMDGSTMRCGGAGAVRDVRNPIDVAWHVMTGSGHSLIVGEAASEFARLHGIRRHAMVPRRGQLARLAAIREEYGTVGCVVMDRNGNIAAAVSTGGVWNKAPGRVGDSAIAGAGYYAKGGVGAAVATGNGDVIIKSGVSRRVCDLLESGMTVQDAADSAISELGRLGGGKGGVIALDWDGGAGVSFNTGMMYHSSRFGNS